MPRDELSFMALQTDLSIPIDWSVRAGLAFPKASTPNLLIVQDPIVSLLRTPMPCLEHWWMARDELSFMALQTD